MKTRLFAVLMFLIISLIGASAFADAAAFSIKKVEERLDGVENRLDALENKFHQLLVLLQKKEEELRLFGAQMKQLEERVAKLEARKG